jgi:hypothetical protein
MSDHAACGSQAVLGDAGNGGPDPRAWRARPGGPSPVRIQILRVPGCPLAGPLRGLVDRCVAGTGLSAAVEEVEGPFRSPTLLINGIDVTGRAAGRGPSCRLDLPGGDQILAALRARAGLQSPCAHADSGA